MKRSFTEAFLLAGEHVAGCKCIEHVGNKLVLTLTSYKPHTTCCLQYCAFGNDFFDTDEHYTETSVGRVMFPGRRPFGERYFCKQKQEWHAAVQEYMPMFGLAGIITGYAPWAGPLYIGWMIHDSNWYNSSGKPLRLSEYTWLCLTEESALVQVRKIHDAQALHNPLHQGCNCLWVILALEVPTSVAVGAWGQSCTPKFVTFEEQPQPMSTS